MNPQHPSWYVPPRPPAPPEERERNGFSIAGLVLGILPITGGILAIIFGLIGRSQAERRGQKGRVMGTWGAALGAIWLVIIVVAVANDIGDDAERGNDGQVSQAGEESAFSLQVGDCLRTIPADLAEVRDLDLVPCTNTHGGEVYADSKLTGSTFPGDKAVSVRSERSCVAAFEPYIGKAYKDSTLDVIYLHPTARSWRLGDRGITCLISGKSLVNTVKGSRR